MMAEGGLGRDEIPEKRDHGAGRSRSAEYEAVQKYKDLLVRRLFGGPDQWLLQEFILRGWLEFDDYLDADQLIDKVLERIDDKSSISVLAEIEDVTVIVKQILALILDTDSKAEVSEKAVENQVKALKRIILQASAAGPGYENVMYEALKLLTRVHTKRPKNERGLNFSDGKGSGQLWTKPFYSPLMHACEGGHVEMVKLLLEKGAKVEFVPGQLEEKSNKKQKLLGPKMSAMHVACIKGRKETVRILLDKAGKHRRDILNAKTKDSWTPLMYAVKEGQSEVVKVLLEEENVDILTINKKGLTTLHIACMNGQLECLKLVHEKIAQQPDTGRMLESDSPQNPYLKTDKKGYNVIHRVCKGPKGNDVNVTIQSLKWILRTLPWLDRRELLNLKTEGGFSCLLLACDCNNVELVEYLVKEKGVDIQSTTVDGKTGLHVAALHDYSAIASLLISNSVSVTVQDEDGNTALHIAMLKSSSNVNSMLRERAPNLLLVQNKESVVPDDVKPEDKIPKEIEKLGEDAVYRYHELLRRGKKKKMPRCNLVALGEQRVGKTSVLCLLTGKRFIADRDPTRGIDNELVDVLSSMNISSETWKEARPSDITEKNEKLFAHSIAEDLTRELSSQQRNIPTPQPEDLTSEINQIHTIVGVPGSPPSSARVRPSSSGTHKKSNKKAHKSHRSPLTPRDVGERPQNQNDIQPPRKQGANQTTKKMRKTPAGKKKNLESDAGAQSHENMPSFPPDMNERLSKIGRNLSKSIVSAAKKGGSPSEVELQFNSLDFAGQKEYRAMHHCFIVRRAIYLVVFNLQVLRGIIHGNPTENTQEALEEIRYWMNSIHAHIHKADPVVVGKSSTQVASEPLRRIMLVGTHRAPRDEDRVMEGDLEKIDEKLNDMFAETRVFNDVFRCGSLWLAPVENSQDQPDQREASGAVLLQKAIRDAWDELPFKDEMYPTTWLRFEAFLQRKRTASHQIVKAAEIRKIAKGEYGIGEENEEDIEMALSFFHDTGTVVYPKRLPKLYLNAEEEEILNELILLDPKWLMKMMRNVMEVKTGRGKLTNEDQKKLEDTGCAVRSVLKKCWPSFGEEDFRHLILMLQSFCLVFPLPQPQVQENHYLIPSKLRSGRFDETQAENFNFSFEIDFKGFLPDELYHRLLCLMIKEVSNKQGRFRGTFNSDFFKVNGIEGCNWIICRRETKLRIWVKHSEMDQVPPSSYVQLIHMDYLQKICNDKGSSLQGLTYIGGPVHSCEERIVVPYVSYPDDENIRESWTCDICLKKCNIDKLLDPKHVAQGDTVPDPRSISHPGYTTTNIENPGVVIVNQAPLTIQLSNPGELITQGEALQPVEGASVNQTPTLEVGTSQLGIGDIHDVLEELVDGHSKWFFIGLALKLSSQKLEIIKSENNDYGPQCMYEMVKAWLNGVDDCSGPTWSNLVTALRRKTVALASIAEGIEERKL